MNMVHGIIPSIIEGNNRIGMDHPNRALVYRLLGRTNEAGIEQAKVDPDKPTYVAVRCCLIPMAKFVERDYDGGIREAQRSRGMYPRNLWPYFILARCATEKGDYPLALDTLQEVRVFNDVPDLLALEGRAYARMGERNKAGEVLRQLQLRAQDRYVAPYCVAWVHAALGNKREAIACLERAVEDRCTQLVSADFGGLRTDPAWDDLQNEPQFKDLLKKVGMDVWPK